jgi:hypothetical protein
MRPLWGQATFQWEGNVSISPPAVVLDKEASNQRVSSQPKKPKMKFTSVEWL